MVLWLISNSADLTELAQPPVTISSLGSFACHLASLAAFPRKLTVSLNGPQLMQPHWPLPGKQLKLRQDPE